MESKGKLALHYENCLLGLLSVTKGTRGATRQSIRVPV
jgi:hypothetical protein